MEAKQIEQRILDEYRKHKHGEWAKLASIKIYNEINSVYQPSPERCPDVNDDNKIITIGEVRKIFSQMYDNLPDDDEELVKEVKKLSTEADSKSNGTGKKKE